jgi:hypothetical protein
MKYYIKVYLLASLLTFTIIAKSQTVSNSVFNSGKWFKIKINETNIYKLTYEDLKTIGFEAPENIRIYGGSGAQLPEINKESSLDDIQEIPLYQNKGSDNIFGSGDYYLFYAEGTTSWKFDSKSTMFVQKIHEYSLSNYYFITASFGEGKRIQTNDFSSLTPNVEINSYTWRGYYEEELYNLGNSGKVWLGKRFDNNDFSEEFTIPDLIKSSPVILSASMAVRSSDYKNVALFFNNKSVDTLSFSRVNTEDSESTLYKLITKTYNFISNSNTISMKSALLGGSPSDQAFVNYFTINAKSSLNLSSGVLFFRDVDALSANAIARYTLSGANSNIQIWDISEINKVFALKSSINNSILKFVARDTTIREYLAVDVTTDFSKPIFTDDNQKDLGWIENQNLHGTAPPELLIVTHPLFIDQANQLADLHREKDNMSVEVVTTQQIYNEFSSGKSDAAAIRNYARFLYKNASSNKPFKYLLLLGDGSYDNRNYNDYNPNYIPTYESVESANPLTSLTTDDFFGQLDDDEWTESTGTIEIGVGRIPIYWDNENGTKEAQAVIDKIISYYNVESMKDWRNQVIFLADDAENAGDMDFIIDSDELTKIVEKKAPMFNINKIYLDAYQQISSSTGASYPEVEKELQRTLNKGALLFNYMGHGGENGITQEKVLQRSDFENLKNAPYFPFYITSTCQLGRFDNVIITSGDNYSRKISTSEAAILNPYGGAIALFTTTRVVYQSSNKDLSDDIFNLIFDKDTDGKRYRLGDIFRISKNNAINRSEASYTNTLKFMLLGDPALTLAFGEFKVLTDSVNRVSIDELTDTANALGSMSISGYVAYDDSTIISDFNGEVQVSVYDKKYTVSTNANDANASKFEFTMQDKLLFHGKASVVNGRFKAEFKLPKDITYSYGKGKISYYAHNGVVDAKGSYEDFYIGGTDPLAQPDYDGPYINLYMNDTNFVDGGITNASPLFLARIYDQNGINTTGNGIGHDLTAILDENFDENYTLNDYFEGDLDSYKSGTALYQFSELETGFHTINFKAWDIYNNSSESSLEFYVENTGSLIINKLFCYPNPMRGYTNFQYSHNLPGNHEVTIKIYDLTGRLIQTINRTTYEQGFVSEPLHWDRNTGQEISIFPGVYAYTIDVKVTTDYNSTAFEIIKSGRLIIIP